MAKKPKHLVKESASALCTSSPHTSLPRGGEPVEVTYGNVTVRTTTPDPETVRKNIEDSGDKLEKLLRALLTPGVTLPRRSRGPGGVRAKRAAPKPKAAPTESAEGVGEA